MTRQVLIAKSCRIRNQLVVLPLIAILYGCGTAVIDPASSEAKITAEKPLSGISDQEWDECQQQARKSINSHEPGPGMGDTGERAAYTYGGALGAIIALISAKSRSPGTYAQEQLEERHNTYWNTMKKCLRDKGYIVFDDSVEVERP